MCKSIINTLVSLVISLFSEESLGDLQVSQGLFYDHCFTIYTGVTGYQFSCVKSSKTQT